VINSSSSNNCRIAICICISFAMAIRGTCHGEVFGRSKSLPVANVGGLLHAVIRNRTVLESCARDNGRKSMGAWGECQIGRVTSLSLFLLYEWLILECETIPQNRRKAGEKDPGFGWSATIHLRADLKGKSNSPHGPNGEGCEVALRVPSVDWLH
jgi:hypothetical protein